MLKKSFVIARITNQKLLFLFLLAFLYNCQSFQKALFTPPKVSFDRVDILDLSFNGAKLNAFIIVDNPNMIGVKLNRVSYEVFLEGHSLVSGAKEEAIDLKGKNRNEFSIPVNLDFNGIKSGLQSVIEKKIVKVRILAKVVLNTPIKDLTFDIDKEIKVTIPDMPRFEVEKVEVAEKSMSSLTLNFFVKISNNQDIQLNLHRLNYLLQINDLEVSREKITIDRKLNDKGKNLRLKIPINIQLMNLKRSFIDVIYSGSFKYKFDIDMALETSYGPFFLPYSNEALVDLY